MTRGYFSLILHAHLPYVRHPEYPYFLEERWYYEAATETYLPLLDVFEGLVRDQVNFRITVSLTPPLVSMMTDPLLQERYFKHLNRLVELSEREQDRLQNQAEFLPLAEMYWRKLLRARDLYERYGGNLVQGFKKFQDLGHLEILTSAATHGFLPLMAGHRPSINAQIFVAAEHYERHFGVAPRGIWLPECGYAPGVDESLWEAGLRFFVLETHGLVHGHPRPKYGVYAPVYCRSGVAAFARDPESSKQVWSAEEGYPGDPDYREFYRDVGFDLDFNYIEPYIHPDGIRIQTGIKYYRITGKVSLADKQPYVPSWALEKAAAHAASFMFNRERQIEWLSEHMDRYPIVVAPYDAELFGHWWYEGPDWINFFLRKAASQPGVFQLTTLSEYLERYPTNQVCVPSASSWGDKGYNDVWLEGSNDWVYRHLHKAARRMQELADEFPQPTALERRALNQAGRELLLAQSSDWAFIMKSGTMVEYAVKRTKDHLLRFARLYRQLKSRSIDDAWLADVEWKDNFPPHINYRVYASDYAYPKTAAIQGVEGMRQHGKPPGERAREV